MPRTMTEISRKDRPDRVSADGLMTVGEGGLEPPHPFEYWHLKPARLPFRHSPEWSGKANRPTDGPTTPKCARGRPRSSRRRSSRRRRSSVCANSRYASGVTSSRMSCRPALAAPPRVRARRRWRRRRSAVGVAAAAARDGRLHHLRLAAVERHHARHRGRSAACDGIDDRLARAQARPSPSTSSSCERERDPQRRRLDVGVEHVAHELDLGDRRLRLGQPQVDERRLLRARARRGSGAPPRATNRSGRYEPSTGGRQPATRTPGDAVGDLARDRRRQARPGGAVGLEPLLRRGGTAPARRCWW